MSAIYRTDDFILPEIEKKPLAVTVGVFDGMHRGHRAVIENLVSFCRENNLSSCVITFSKNPKDRFYSEKQQNILTPEEKYEILEKENVDIIIEINFTPEFKAMSGLDFITMLENRLAVRKYFVGEDFVCGNSAVRLTAAELKKMFPDKVSIVPQVKRGNEKISSSVIREEIKKSDGVITEDIRKKYLL